MTWLAPWALLGLVGAAAPVIVHWLARHHARKIRFPTIEFLMRSSPVSVQRHRLKDKRLMAIRMAIVAVAAVALAQPVWVRPDAPAAQPARAVVVDTSASMQRSLADGRVGADVARETAAASAPSLTLSTDRVAEGVARAAAWLARQTPPRELVVVSDFQVGALVESDLDTVPEDAQVRLVPIALSGPVPATPSQPRGTLRVLVAREQAARAGAAQAAARTVTQTSEVVSSGNDPSGRLLVTLVFPSAEDRDHVWEATKPIGTPELFAWVADIRQHLQRLGQPNELVADWRAFDGPTPGLAVFTDADPGTEQAASLMAAILGAAAPPVVSEAEREPDTLGSRRLEGWQRTGSPASSAARSDNHSDGRWFWLIALVLFGVEAWVRRRPTEPSVESVHANAA
jgi:hypothetical protein